MIRGDLADGVMLGARTRDILRQPAGIVNRNVVIADTQATMSRSQKAPRSDTVVDMTGDAKVSDVIVSGSSVMLRGASDADTDVDAATAAATATARAGKMRMRMKMQPEPQPKDAQVVIAEEPEPEPVQQRQERYVVNIIAQRIGEESMTKQWRTGGEEKPAEKESEERTDVGRAQATTRALLRCTTLLRRVRRSGLCETPCSATTTGIGVLVDA